MVCLINIGLIQESFATYKLIEAVLSWIAPLTSKEQFKKKNELYLRYGILVAADLSQIIWVIVFSDVKVSAENPHDAYLQNSILPIVPAIMVSLHIFASTDFLYLIKDSILDRPKEVVFIELSNV